MDTSTVVGIFSIAGNCVLGLLVWSLQRNVKHEDAARAQQQADIEALKKDVVAIRSDMTDAAHKAEMDARDASSKLSTLAGSMGELKGALQSLHGSFDTGREKQADFYRTELLKLEQSWRQELTRHVHPDVPERLRAVEAKVELLSKRSKRKP